MKRTDVVNIVLNGAIVLLLAGLLLSKSGAIGQPLTDYFRARTMRADIAREWTNLVASASGAAGSSGEVDLVEFVDYECPGCRVAHSVARSTQRGHPEITVAYRHFPLPIHPAAEAASRAAICAERQDRFREMHSHLMESTEWQAGVDWVRLALDIGVEDTLAFSRCLPAQETTERLEQDKAFAERLGIRVFPTFVYPEGFMEGLADSTKLLNTAQSKGS